jgi:hypothetical protein
MKFKLLLRLQSTFLTITMYSGTVDVFGSLTEKLKQQVNDTQNQYESFVDATQLYKQGKMNEKEFITKISDYVVATSAMNFLAIRVILEMKSAIDKGTSMKNATGGTTAASSSSSAPQQQEPTFKPVDMELERPFRKSSGKETTMTTITKNCIVCGSAIPKQAKFCSKCGNLQ